MLCSLQLVLCPLPCTPRPQAAGTIGQGDAYRLVVAGPGGSTLIRRDPWARSAEAASSWCFAHNPAAYAWQNTSWKPLSYDKVRALHCLLARKLVCVVEMK